MIPIRIVETDRDDFDQPVVELWRDDEFIGMVFWDEDTTFVQIYPDDDGDVKDIELATGVKAVADEDAVVLTVREPLVRAEPVAGEAATAEPEVISKGKPEEAVSILRRAIDLDPNRADLYMLRSRARDSSGKFDAALEDASKFVELEPNEPLGYLNRARIYLSLEKEDKALEDANKAIELAPNESDGYYRRADIYNQMGKEAEAKADEAKAEQLDSR